ncbi:hypothetical protein Lal_00033694 [Lupinus albus]|nr:hypothetical protein Lal_00033694 [Lupinus albus]
MEVSGFSSSRLGDRGSLGREALDDSYFQTLILSLERQALAQARISKETQENITMSSTNPFGDDGQWPLHSTILSGRLD